MAFAARPDGEGHVKISDHYYLIFSVIPESWLSWAKCTQQARLTEKDRWRDGFLIVASTGRVGRVEDFTIQSYFEMSAFSMVIDERFEKRPKKAVVST